MSAPPKADQKRLGFLLVVLLAVAAAAFWPRSGPTLSRSASSRQTAKHGKGATFSPEAVPTLAVFGPEASRETSVVRNVFRFYVPPTKVPTRVPPTPTPLPRQGSLDFIGPRLPTPTPTATPIIPPAIPYKLVGLFGSHDRPIVAFEEGGRLINAHEGDTLDGRFIVKKVNQESVDFAFVGLPPTITRRLGMAPPEAAR